MVPKQLDEVNKKIFTCDKKNSAVDLFSVIIASVCPLPNLFIWQIASHTQKNW